MMVFGREVTGPLELLYCGCIEKQYNNIEIEEWLVKLNDILAIIHDS